MSSGYCDAVNPETGDRCQEARGHPGGHYVTRVDRWETPYRMAEPENVGASVISDGTVFTRTDNSDTPWRQHHDLGLAPLRWDWIRSPLPFQNCVITANDPELPVGSVVWDADCGPYERINGGMWVSTRTGYKVTSADLSETPVTLLYRGDA